MLTDQMIDRIAQRIRIDCESGANHNLIRLVGQARYFINGNIFFEKEFTENLYRCALFSGRGDAIAFYMLFNKLNYNIKF
jgi:hypothetical protein